MPGEYYEVLEEEKGGGGLAAMIYWHQYKLDERRYRRQDVLQHSPKGRPRHGNNGGSGNSGGYLLGSEVLPGIYVSSDIFEELRCQDQ